MDSLGIYGFHSINAFVDNKIQLLSDSDHTFKSIFSLMTRERSNIFMERTDGYRVFSTTYQQFYDRTILAADFFSKTFAGIEHAPLIGIHMGNSELWLESFWGLLMAGFRPLLMNIRLSQEVLDGIISDYSVAAVISDGRVFNTQMVLADSIKLDDGAAIPDFDSFIWADEIVLMTSGTSTHVKLCTYCGENIYYQICDSAVIIRSCKRIKTHYHNRMKLLTFLPLYHIFGLIAVFMWFCFFSRTLVLLNDFSGDTILNTVSKLEVTHIFAVPLLWNTIYSTAIKTIKKRDEKTQKKFEKGMRIYEKLSGCAPIAEAFSKLAFKQVRDGIFGESIIFLITGGSAVSSDTLRFFNSIGYHLADGYGMTEIGITSVELTDKFRYLTDGSVGMPFSSVEYRISPSGELEVKGKTLATHVFCEGREIEFTSDGWYETHDRAERRGDRYYILGRQDDVIIGPDGENLNPDILEPQLKIDGADSFTILKNSQGAATLLISVPALYDAAQLNSIKTTALKELQRLNLSGVVKEVVLTNDPLINESEIKVNRAVLSKKLAQGELHIADGESAKAALVGLNAHIAEVIAEVLSIPAEKIGADDDFFTALGGSSLDYFSVVSMLRKEYGTEFPVENGNTISTVSGLAAFIRKNGTVK